MRQRGLLIMSLLICCSLWSPAYAAYMVTGSDADKTTFLGLLNTASVGGTWTLSETSQLVFGPNGMALNNFSTELNLFNNTAGVVRTLDVKQNYPGVLVGGFGPKLGLAAGTQALDLGDIQMFKTTIAQEPLLDLQSSVLLHELREVFQDGGNASFSASHQSAIGEQNAELAALGSRGVRQPGPDIWEAMPNGTWEYRFPWLDFPTGIAGFEVIKGTGAFNISNIAPGIDDPGPDVSYDGSGHDIAITSVIFEVVPGPSTWLLLGSGFVGLVLARRKITA